MTQESEEIDADNDISQTLPYQEILTGHQDRFLDAHAVIGYSQGGGAAHDLVEALYLNEELLTRAVVYLDAVNQDGRFAEQDWPEVTVFTLNIWEEIIELPINFGGGPIDPSEYQPYGATVEPINTTNDPGWDATLDHFTIDDNPAIQQRIRTRLQTWLVQR